MGMVMATLDHESFLQPSDQNVGLWRYMDLSKFAALLQKRSLVFARSDKLGDPFEGSMPVGNYTIQKVYDQLRKLQPGIGPFANMSDDLYENMKLQMIQARQSIRRAVYISCWHMNDAESAAMWKLYSKSSDAICIKTSYSKLALSLPSDCHMGIIEYLDYKKAAIKTGNMFNNFLIKRLSFSHEREARAIIMSGDAIGQDKPPDIFEIPVDLDKFIDAVYISPEATDWFRDVVKNMCSKYELDVAVEHSELNGTPLF
jgi:hypothetical protein